ncbi:MAG: universal stress protein [Betaproteobacteria bacterium]|nr:universal stress protein [Betaproteobacteria bacterium]
MTRILIAVDGSEHAERAVEHLIALRKRAGIDFRLHLEMGDAAEIIAKFAKKLKCEGIVMGTRGLGPVKGLVMGSVATKVLHLAAVPVTLVKQRGPVRSRRR